MVVSYPDKKTFKNLIIRKKCGQRTDIRFRFTTGVHDDALMADL